MPWEKEASKLCGLLEGISHLLSPSHSRRSQHVLTYYPVARTFLAVFRRPLTLLLLLSLFSDLASRIPAASERNPSRQIPAIVQMYGSFSELLLLSDEVVLFLSAWNTTFCGSHRGGCDVVRRGLQSRMRWGGGEEQVRLNNGAFKFHIQASHR